MFGHFLKQVLVYFTGSVFVVKVSRNLFPYLLHVLVLVCVSVLEDGMQMYKLIKLN